MPITRITAGEWRGRVVDTPSSRAVRPTTGKVREALFNILGELTEGARWIDLYAGAGTVGFEALSRGAEFVTFVERDRQALASIRSTATRFGCLDRCELTQGDVAGWVKVHAAEVAASDICFLDAPYSDAGFHAVLRLVGSGPPPLVICEHHHAEQLQDRIGKLERTRTARYGLATLSFFKPVPE